MTAPTFLDCRCDHAKAEHERDGFAPQCIASGCTCLRYRPQTTVAAAPVPRPPMPAAPVRREPEIVVRDQRPPSIEQILQAGKRSEFARTVKLTEKIALEIHDLRGRLTDEREATEEKHRRDAEQAAARAEVERLQRELAEAKAKASGKTAPPTRSPNRGDGVCPDCGKTGLSNVGVHRSKKHGYRRAS